MDDSPTPKHFKKIMFVQPMFSNSKELETEYTIANPSETSHLAWKIKASAKNSIIIDKQYGVLEP